MKLILRTAALTVALVLAPYTVFGATPGLWLGPDQLTRVAREWLVERLRGEVEPQAIDVAAPPRDLTLPAGDVAMQVTLQSGSVEAGAMTVLVEAVVTEPRGTRTSRSTTVTFKIRPTQDVVVAVRELPRRTVLTAADVRRERRAGSRVPTGAVHDPALVVGRELTRTMAPGEVVTAHSTTAPLLIRRGSVVVLVLEGANFKIVARGVAAEDGALGAVIRVMNQSSRREVVGRVEDDRTVRVAF